jgi:cytochrome c oxidase subunit II
MKQLLSVATFLIGSWVVPSSLWAKPSGEPGVGLPRDVSLEGHRIDWLLQVTNVFIVILFVIMCGWMLWAMVKHSRDNRATADYDHGTSHHSITTAIVLSLVVFLVVDGNLFYNAIVDLDEAYWNEERISGPDVLRVEINARQWAWQIRYAGPDNVFATQDDIVTLNEMPVPVDRPVAVQLRAVDVIHSFSLPNLRVKIDAVPGMTNKTWFQVDSKKLEASGPVHEFDIACTQHCGTHHYKMAGVLKAYSAEDFARWQKEASINSILDYDPIPTEAQVESGDGLPEKYQGHWGWKWEET